MVLCAALLFAGRPTVAQSGPSQPLPSSGPGVPEQRPSATPDAMAIPPGPPESLAGSPAAVTAPPGRVLTLQQLERFAVTQQPQILIARSQIDSAAGTVEQARAGFLPQITAIGEYSYGNSVRPTSLQTTTTTAGSSSSSSTTTTGTSSSSQSTGATSGASTITLTSPTGFWDFGLSATQLIYDFGQTPGRYRSASETLDSQRFAEKTTLLQVLLSVRSAYFTARADKDLVAVAVETLQDQETHLTQVQGMVQVGTQPQIALAQQRAAVANAEVQLITARNNYETAKAQLNQAVGLREGTDYDVGDEIIPPVDDEEQPLETLVAKALSARPEIATLLKQRQAQEATISATKGAYGPTLSALGTVAEEGTALNGLQPFWSVGVLLSWPIFQGGLTHGQVRSAEAALANIAGQQALEDLQVRFGVDSAQLAVRAAKATIGAAQDAVTNAREQLRLAEQRYATGVGSIIELDDAQVAYTSAAAQLVQARYSLATARAQLLAALGRT